MKDFVICKICNFTSKDIRFHIRSKHKNVTVDEYKTKYGEVVSELTKFKRSVGVKIAHNTNKVKQVKKEKMIKIRANKKWASYGMKGKTAWNKGLTIEDSRVAKYTKNRNTTMNKKYWQFTTYEQMYGEEKAKEIKLKQSKALTAVMKDKKVRSKISSNNWLRQYKGQKLEDIYGEEKAKEIKKHLSNAQSMSKYKPKRNSTGEKEVLEFVQELKVPFEHDKFFKDNLGRPDFSFPELNKIIEYNGCYWHNHLCMNNIQPNDSRVLHNIHRWKNKLKICNKNNIDVLVIWECEWNKNKNKVKQQILKFLGIENGSKKYEK